MKTKIILGVIAAAIVAACADFSSGECTDKALCDGTDASTFDNTTSLDAPIDVNVDTLVVPDGNVPDGECNGGAEDCGNGIDDNCNGLVDCADPVCQNAGYVCAGPPAGWTGPVALASIAGGAFPSCTGSYATPAEQGHDGVAGLNAQCTCGCSGPTGVSCNTGIGINYYTDSCNTLYEGEGLPNVGFCVTSGGASSVVASEGVTQATAFNGTCTSTPSMNVPALTYANSYVACSYDGPVDKGGCTNNAQCVQAPSNGKTCVYQAGDVGCPATTYTTKTLFYLGDDDTRTCATCTCTATAGTCTGTINVYSGPSCTGTLLATIATGGVCTTTTGADSAEATGITTNPGTCGNNGTGGPTGSVSATNPVTVCCEP